MPTARRRILCVEDHADTRSMLTLLLELAGYYVTAAENATVGLALAQTQTFDLLILDIWLPDGDGNNLCLKVSASAATASADFITFRTRLTLRSSTNSISQASATGAVTRLGITSPVNA